MPLVVVSGASRGIGKAIAVQFAKKGFDLAIAARGLTELEDLKSELESNFGIRCLAYRADLSHKEEVQSFAQLILEQFNAVDVLVNNAGLFLAGRISDEPEGQLENLMAINVYSAYYLSRGLLPAIKKNEGHIFNISSVAGLKAYPQGGSYSIVKFALSGLSASLREELKSDKVRVTTVYPGATFTDSWKGVDLPESRFIAAEDVAACIYNSWELSKRTVIEEIVMRPQEGDI